MTTMGYKPKKIVLAYSGGLDTSVILKWLKEQYGCEVICYSADIGQDEQWDDVREKAWATGADQVVIRDLKEEFVRDFVFPMMRANAVYEGHYLLGTSIARPLIAKEQVRVARELGADAVSHGATGKGNESSHIWPWTHPWRSLPRGGFGISIAGACSSSLQRTMAYLCLLPMKSPIAWMRTCST